MLTTTEQDTAGLDTDPNKSIHAENRTGSEARPGRGRLAKMLQIEWLGQTVASLCWIASVPAYGISSTGDWLQLCAASAWLTANIAALATETD